MSLDMPGGFVGVDIFFVISGFLITSIISKELHNNTFSFKNFYLRRIRRIVPAYIVVVFCTLLAGMLILLPEDLNILAKSALWSTFAAPNIYFWKYLNIGYFADSAKLQSLLHLWSLGVEEQFYMLWPITLFCFHKVVRANYLKVVTIISIVLISLLSFYLAQRWLFVRPKFAYYMLPTRVGELLIGAIIAQATSYKLQNIVSKTFIEFLSFLGIGLLIFSMVYLNEKQGFPGLNALYPCIGSALLIYTGQQNTLIARLLSIKLMVGVGLISYSLYLCHWPIISFVTYIFVDFDAHHVIYIILSTIIMSILSYNFIEKPFKNKQKILYNILLLLTTILVLIICLNTRHINKYIHRDVQGNNELKNIGLTSYSSCIFRNYADYERVAHNIKKCFSSTTLPTNSILFGDSNATHFIPYLKEIANFYNWSFYIYLLRVQ